MNVQNAPKQDVPVGYKQTEVGMIPEGWEVRSIEQFTDCTAGGTPSTKISSYWGGSHPWMSSGELHFKQVFDVAERITDEGLSNSSTKYVPKDSVLIGLAGQGKTRGTVAINRISLCTNQSIAAIFPSSEYCTEYLFYNLDNRYEELRSLSTGDGGRGGLNLTIIRKLIVPFPPLEEQTAIANALSDVDSLLNELEKLIAKKQAIKTATMQQLLTGKTRLPQFALREDGTAKGYKTSELGELPEDWEVVNFSSIAMLKNNRINPKINGAEDYCIELEHIEQGTGEIAGSTETTISSSIKNIFTKDDILFGKLRAYLKKYWKATQDGVCSTEIWVLKAAPQKSTSEFIFQTVQTERFIEVASEAYGTHMPRSDWKTVKEFQLAIPLLQEQTSIATILSDMDEEIQSLRQRLDKTRQIKQGMMQELLTGKTRLVKPTQQRN
ncbi:restriction endonuclease subunit S [Photorhabdus stackebrandtii]|uniref:Restriction endonuclease subunit S n=1 Tax=Photorhabdus stackebrandtii TaxID=1123042 RepID=A0A7X5TMB9_9GAMM|nr:restriction endonuclease subunit S [Photorhabdus stackebrandtii]NHB96857.1 restriction endonuclease subunit S [Photorhabdus stackebrandtii]